MSLALALAFLRMTDQQASIIQWAASLAALLGPSDQIRLCHAFGVHNGNTVLDSDMLLDACGLSGRYMLRGLAKEKHVHSMYFLCRRG